MPPPETIEAPPSTEPIGTSPPPGVGPTPAKTNVGDKFRTELARIEAEQKAKETPPEATPEPEKAEPEAKPTEKPVEEPKVEAKPESPLDVLTEKPAKEEKPTVDTDSVIGDLDKIEVPKSEHWKRARETLKTQAEELKALKTAPKPAADESPWIKKTEELQKALDERENTIKAINAEYSQEYQGMLQQRGEQLGRIANRAKAFGADGDALVDALQMPMGKVRTAQIKEAMAELDSDDKARMHTLIENLESHDEKIIDFRKDLPRKYDEIVAAQQQYAAEQHQNALKQLETEFGKISEIVPDDVVTFRKVDDSVPGATEWNKEIDKAMENAIRVLKPDGADFRESVIVALKGQRYDDVEKRYLESHKENMQWRKRYAAEDAAAPDFKGGSKPTPKVDQKPGVKFREALAQRLAAGDPDQ